MRWVRCLWCGVEVYTCDSGATWRHVTGMVSCVVNDVWLPGTFAEPNTHDVDEQLGRDDFIVPSNPHQRWWDERG